MADGVFKLKIELGKGKMTTRPELIDALSDVQGGIDAGSLTGSIRDSEDNNVGRWTIDGTIDEPNK